MLEFSVALRPQIPYGILLLESPGRPPQLSHRPGALQLCHLCMLSCAETSEFNRKQSIIYKSKKKGGWGWTGKKQKLSLSRKKERKKERMEGMKEGSKEGKKERKKRRKKK